MFSNQHFIINELKTSDALALSKLMVENTARFQKYFPQTLAQNLTEAASLDYIGRKQKENASKSEFTWAIRDTSGSVGGLLILKELNWENRVGEFAYCIGAAYEGRGWITETVKNVTAYAFAELKLQTLQIIAHKTNVASVRIAEKCGYRWQKQLLKSHTPPDGIALDMELYERYNDSVI